VDEVAVERAAAGHPVSLTVREREALVDLLIARGFGNQEIQARAGIRHAQVAARRG
jgi:DNA-binding CsgD family transcriptional regulator